MAIQNNNSGNKGNSGNGDCDYAMASSSFQPKTSSSFKPIVIEPIHQYPSFNKASNNSSKGSKKIKIILSVAMSVFILSCGILVFRYVIN